MSNEVMKNIMETDLFQELKDETIQDLLDEKEKIETSTELNWFQRTREKLKNDIKLKLLWHEDSEEEEKEEDDTQETPETQAETDEIFDKTKELLYIDKITENKEEFDLKVREIAQNLDVNPNRLMQIMDKESSLNHKAINKDSGATWLIQFMPETAQWLGTTTDALKNMSNIEQLDFVEKYYAQYADKIHSHTDLYLATFYPAALGKPDNYIIWSERGKEKIIGKQNNMNNKKPITVAHVKSWISKDIPGEYLAQFQTTATEEDAFA